MDPKQGLRVPDESSKNALQPCEYGFRRLHNMKKISRMEDKTYLISVTSLPKIKVYVRI